jgi:hypothetical protein
MFTGESLLDVVVKNEVPHFVSEGVLDRSSGKGASWGHRGVSSNHHCAFRLVTEPRNRIIRVGPAVQIGVDEVGRRRRVRLNAPFPALELTL